jgi:hypothetical protein
MNITNELKDDDESIQDLILYKHCLINSKKINEYYKRSFKFSMGSRIV